MLALQGVGTRTVPPWIELSIDSCWEGTIQDRPHRFLCGSAFIVATVVVSFVHTAFVCVADLAGVAAGKALFRK